MRSARIMALAGIAAVVVMTGGTTIADAAPAPAHPVTVVPFHVRPVAHPAKPVARAGYVVTTGRLAIRSGPGPRYRTVGTLRRGARVTASTRVVNGFREISAGHWVPARFLTAARR